jgi:hypothetical protein
MTNPTPPLIPEKFRMPLRIAAVFLGYVIYLVLEEGKVVGPAFVGFGSVVLLWAIIDRYATWRRDRSGLMQVGSTILGLAFIAIGLYLVLR